MLPLELYHLIFAYLDNVQRLRNLSPNIDHLVTTYYLQQLRYDPHFAYMPEVELRRYISKAKIICVDPLEEEEESVLDSLQIIPRKIYYGDADEQYISFIDADYNVYIRTQAVDVKGVFISCMLDPGDTILFYIQGYDGVWYLLRKGKIKRLNITFTHVDGRLGLSEGRLMIYKGYSDDPFLLATNENRKYTELAVANPNSGDDIYTFLVYLKDENGCHWIAKVKNYHAREFVLIVPPKDIKSVSCSTHYKNDYVCFAVLFTDGSAGLLLVSNPGLLLLSNDNMHFTFVQLSAEKEMMELEDASFYDAQGLEYEIVKGKELQATGYSKWHSCCGRYMITY